MEVSRRDALAALVVSGTAALMSGDVRAADKVGAAPGQHVPVPLPFDPKKLSGLSERLLVSHHDNNYAGAVNNLNKVEAELARVTKDTPAFVVGGLKERELTFTNSLILHELYFGNLGGNGKAGGAVRQAIVERYGSYDRWESEFRASGMSLAGGSGWVILASNFQTGELRTYWSGHHTQAVAFGAPLLVMDMYEHAYQMDYGAAAAKYIDAFFANVHWEEVDQRLARARAAAAALRPKR